MRVCGVKFILIDEANPQKVIATKYARIHASDVDAGEYHVMIKSKEIFKDALLELGKCRTETRG